MESRGVRLVRSIGRATEVRSELRAIHAQSDNGSMGTKTQTDRSLNRQGVRHRWSNPLGMIKPALTYFRVSTIIGPDCLTAVFGMGTGVASQVWAPAEALETFPRGSLSRRTTRRRRWRREMMRTWTILK